MRLLGQAHSGLRGIRDDDFGSLRASLEGFEFFNNEFKQDVWALVVGDATKHYRLQVTFNFL